MAEHNKNGRPSPICFRLNEEERAVLGKAAAGMPLNAYVRLLVLNDSGPRRRTRGLSPVKDHQLLGQLLGQLGASHLSSNLRELAEACRSGSLPLTSETETALLDACANVQAMKQMLMRALGVQSEGNAP